VLRGGLYLILENVMKKGFKIMSLNNDEVEEIDGLDEMLDEVGENSTWLDTGDMTILIPTELAECLDKAGVLGLA
tara:strand:- start:3122 stop:3346 length:225 start_codon:yes stop_codon:yes gene_type:complete